MDLPLRLLSYAISALSIDDRQNISPFSCNSPVDHQVRSTEESLSYTRTITSAHEQDCLDKLASNIGHCLLSDHGHLQPQPPARLRQLTLSAYCRAVRFSHASAADYSQFCAGAFPPFSHARPSTGWHAHLSFSSREQTRLKAPPRDFDSLLTRRDFVPGHAFVR